MSGPQAGDTAHALEVAWEPVDFTFRTDNPDARRHLAHHCHTSLPPARPDSSRVDITTICDPDELDRMRKAHADAVDPEYVSAFGDPRYFARVPVRDGTALLVKPLTDGRVALRRESGEAERWSVLVADPGTGYPEKRLAAEIIRRTLATRPHLLLHAAAVLAGPDRGIALVGASGAGKTTAALVLGAAGALCSGDRISVSTGSQPPRLVAYPDAVRVGFGAARALGVDQTIATAALERTQDFLTPDGEIKDDCWKSGSRVKASLTRLEIERLLGVPVGLAGPLIDLVVLCRGAEAGAPRIRRREAGEPVSPEVREVVAAQDMALRSEYLPWLPSSPPAVHCDPGAVSSLLDRVRVWEVEWTPSVDGVHRIADALAIDTE